MLRLIHQHSQPTVLASVVLTLALVSDSVLYLLLPLYFEDFGLTLIWVGILLSANRFVRLLINPWLLPWFERFGPRTSMLQAVALATAASLAFLMLASPWVLLLARLLWGMAYALMRLGCLHYATHQPERRMVNLGWYTSLQEVGPLSVLLIAPWLVQFFAIEAVLVLASGLCLMALWPALALPPAQSDPQAPTRARFPWPNAWHRLTFVLCLLFDGVWTVVLAPLLVVAGWSTAAALAMTAWLLVAKRVFNLLVGVVSIRVNPWVPERLWLGISLALMLVAGGLMALTEVLWASVFAIAGHGLYMILVPKRLADEALSDDGRHHSLNGFTFWRDLAAAVGALLASLLLTGAWTPLFYGLLTGLVAVMLLSARYGVTSSTSN